VKLEHKIIDFFDLGRIDFEDLEREQKKYLSDPKKNYVLLHARVNPHINFGSNPNKNQFNNELTSYYKTKFEKFCNEKGHILPEVIEKLTREGVRGIPFSKSERGGGATVYTPGQYLFFPIVKISHGPEDYNFAVKDFNERMHNVMLKATNSLVPNAFLKEVGYSETIKDVCKDLYVKKDEMDYKIGSKGIKVDYKTGKTIGGFSIFVHDENINLMDYVHVCGFKPDEMQITTIKNILGYEPNPKTVITSVLEEFEKEFKCTIKKK
jgi:lipoate-protein ligase B